MARIEARDEGGAGEQLVVAAATVGVIARPEVWERVEQGFAKKAYKRLEILEAATSREDLMALPRHRFEALSGDRSGQYSIRINQ